jgi:hypothetical protein
MGRVSLIALARLDNILACIFSVQIELNIECSGYSYCTLLFTLHVL